MGTIYVYHLAEDVCEDYLAFRPFKTVLCTWGIVGKR